MIENQYGRELIGSTFIGRVMPKTELDIWISQKNEPCNLLKLPGRLLKSNGEFRSGLVQLADDRNSQKISQIFVKEYGFSRKIGIIKALVGWSRAPRAWKASWHLLNNGIPVPKPFGYFVYKKGEKWGKSYFCCTALVEGMDLASFAQKEKNILKESISDGLFARIVTGIARLHQLGVLHGDLKWHNIHVDMTNKQYWFTDLDSCIINRNLSKNRIIARDLSRFIVGGLEVGLTTNSAQEILCYYAEKQRIAYEKLKELIKPRLQKLLIRKNMISTHILDFTF